MTMGLIFWVLMLIWFVFGILSIGGYTDRLGHYGMYGNVILLFVLFVLLGWKVFGRPVQDM